VCAVAIASATMSSSNRSDGSVTMSEYRRTIRIALRAGLACIPRRLRINDVMVMRGPRGWPRPPRGCWSPGPRSGGQTRMRPRRSTSAAQARGPRPSPAGRAGQNVDVSRTRLWHHRGRGYRIVQHGPMHLDGVCALLVGCAVEHELSSQQALHALHTGTSLGVNRVPAATRGNMLLRCGRGRLLDAAMDTM
jgi:hypothetical protein